MKKTMLILSVLTLLTHCKNKEQKVVGTNENGQELVVNEDGDTVAVAENDSLNLNNTNPTTEYTALIKNEDESYSFRYNLKKGKTYPLDLKISQTQTLKSDNQSMTISGSRTIKFDYLVEDIKDEHYHLLATFKGFSETSKGPDGQTLSYNTASAKPADEDVAQSWLIHKSIIGQSFKMVIDNKGKVISVNGLEKVVSNALANLKTDFTKEEKDMIQQMLGVSLSVEAIKSQFEESLNIFPDKNLKVGEEWEDAQNISEGPIKGTNKVTRKFQELNNGVAKIKVTGVQNVNGNNTQNGVTATMKNHATLNGYIDLDLESGWVKKMEVTKKETASTTLQQGDLKQTETSNTTLVTTVN